jgi:hypothetical protein
MTMFPLKEAFKQLKNQMAKARNAPIDEALVATYLERLKAVGSDRPALDRVIAELKGNKRLKAVDVIAIAQRYVGGGKKVPSKGAAYTAISKRFVEIARFHAKNKVADKVRPW